MKNVLLFLGIIIGSSIAMSYECHIYAVSVFGQRLKNGGFVTNVSSLNDCYNLALSKASQRHEANGGGYPVELKWHWSYNDGYLFDSSGTVNFRTPQVYSHPGTGDRAVSEFDLFRADSHLDQMEAEARSQNEFE